MTTIDPGLPLSRREGWQKLLAHRTALASLDLTSLFGDDPYRADHMNASGAGLFFDYSKNRITKGTLELLLDLARECHLPDHIEQMFSGEKDQSNGKSGRPACRPSLFPGRCFSGRRRQYRTRGPLRSRPDGPVYPEAPERRMAGTDRFPDPKRRQYWNRRLRSRACHGV